MDLIFIWVSLYSITPSKTNGWIPQSEELEKATPFTLGIYVFYFWGVFVAIACNCIH